MIILNLKNTKEYIYYFCVVSISILVACATPQRLENYPLSEIDRPYTLPEDVNSWGTYLTGVFDRSNLKSTHGFAIFPFNWEQGLSDRLTLVWSPLPLQVRYQAYRDSVSFLGIYFNLLGPTYARGYDFNWSPTLHLTYRRKLTSIFALQGTLIGEPEVKSKQAVGNGTSGLQLATWFQVVERLAVAFKPHFLWESGDPRSRYFGELPPDRSEKSRFLFPISAEIEGVLSRRWQVNFEYQWLSSPEAQEFMSHQLLGHVRYYF